MTPPGKEQRSRRGWYLYDWANSAFATVILAALLPVYFADAVVPAGGFVIGGTSYSATTLWGYISGLATLIIFLLAPMLGALADLTSRRRLWLLRFFLPGALTTCLLLLVGPGDVVLCLSLYLLAASCFVSANIFYDSFLPFLGPPEEHHRISTTGFAWGYLGGGLIFLLDLILIQSHAQLGLEKGWAVRIALASAGLWWGLFGLLSWRLLTEPVTAGTGSREGSGEGASADPAAMRGGRLLGHALERIGRTLRESVGKRNLTLFLVAYFFFNDGVQTVVKMASIYGKEELGLTTGTLMGTLLMVQFLGIFGALLFGQLAGKLGGRQTLMLSLLIWIGVVTWAWRMHTAWEFWLLGGAVGFCLGGTQALSRSYFTRFIPADRSAEYFGFYSVFAKFSAIGGPILFGFIRQVTGTARYSILALGAFFVIGLVGLSLIREGEE